jgi:acyl-CoA reductase-like NAD-dependent aldehyde dehydrogenase
MIYYTTQVDDAQLQKILKLCESGKRDGAKCVLGGSRYITNDIKKGYYMQPTIFADVTDNMEVCMHVLNKLQYSTKQFLRSYVHAIYAL